MRGGLRGGIIDGRFVYDFRAWLYVVAWSLGAVMGWIGSIVECWDDSINDRDERVYHCRSCTADSLSYIST